MVAMSRAKSRAKRLQSLKDQGFDLAEYDKSTSTYRVRCSQCVAASINGLPCHELCCPNSKLSFDTEEEDEDGTTLNTE